MGNSRFRANPEGNFKNDRCNGDIIQSYIFRYIILLTFVIVPGLLSSVHHTPSSTSESVSILVNVDEQTNCDGVERLTITATLTEGVIDMIVSTQQADFADSIITFKSISAGDYTCSVTVEDETGPVESMQIPCGGTDCVYL